MPLPEGDSSVGHSFGLEFDGVMIKSITEISGLKIEQDVVEFKENGPDGKYQLRRLPGRPKAPDITLTRGLTGDNSFDKWIESSRFGKMSDSRKGGSVIDLMVMPSNSRPNECAVVLLSVSAIS